MTTNKKNNLYKILLQEIELKDGSTTNQSLELTFGNHDDLFKIIELTKAKGLLPHESESIQFILGLKLLGEVVLNNKNHPLFEELKPAIAQFMKKIKQAK